MANMFYTVDEAAEKLGVSADQVRQMAAEHKLQQFRDRDKLMFKREEVDAMASSDATDTLSDTDASPITLADSGDTDAINMKSDSTASGETGFGDQSGVDVFKPDEVDAADPMAQTQVTSSTGDDDLAIESIGSGSGLLDLTRESDDTSLGAELLDEIKPGAEGDDSMASGIGATGAFDTAAMETGASGPSGLENLSAAGEGPSTGPAPATGGYAAVRYGEEASDPAGNGLGAGMLLVCLAALILGLIVAVSALQGLSGGLTAFLAGSSTNYFLVVGGLAVLAIIAGGIGLFIGKAMDR